MGTHGSKSVLESTLRGKGRTNWGIGSGVRALWVIVAEECKFAVRCSLELNADRARKLSFSSEWYRRVSDILEKTVYSERA